MKQYLELLDKVVSKGEPRLNRTGIYAIGVFNGSLTFDISDFRIPILTTKYVHLHSVIHELLWMLKGETNIKYLKDNKVRIWDEWADDKGELGKIYGHQWRNWGGTHDQIYNLIRQIKTDPYSRRHIVSAWNVSDLDRMSLPPCHVFQQYYVDTKNRLSCNIYQRSADLFLGVPFNIASYGILTTLIAQQTGLEPYKLNWLGGDIHIYNNHLKQVSTQLSREPLQPPKLYISKAESINSYTEYHFKLCEYKHHGKLNGKVAV